MREKYEALGNKMISELGFENETVICFWKAWEADRWILCELHYQAYLMGL